MSTDQKCPKCNSQDTMFSKKKQVFICEDCEHEFTVEKEFVPRRVFISYGRDEHALLAEKIKNDLLARGHEVLF